ncbi:MAG: sortase [Chloroflexi bacterium]|nr:sortase [Chloroflexota bacterium]
MEATLAALAVPSSGQTPRAFAPPPTVAEPSAQAPQAAELQTIGTPPPDATPQPGAAAAAGVQEKPDAQQPASSWPEPLDAIGRLAIPKLGLDAPIVEVSWRLVSIEGQSIGQWDAVEGAVGHHLGSAPLAGRGHCVLSGHSRADAGSVFSRLTELVPGDRITVQARDGASRDYRVDATYKLPEVGVSLEQRRENARYASPSEEDRLTLITCWPEWAYTHRIVVIARPVSG